MTLLAGQIRGANIPVNFARDDFRRWPVPIGHAQLGRRKPRPGRAERKHEGLAGAAAGKADS